MSIRAQTLNCFAKSQFLDFKVFQAHGDPWGQWGPWGPLRPIGAHGADGGPWGPMGTHGAHGDPWGPMGTNGDPWRPMGTVPEYIFLRSLRCRCQKACFSLWRFLVCCCHPGSIPGPPQGALWGLILSPRASGDFRFTGGLKISWKP